jgi:hypothetical protein
MIIRFKNKEEYNEWLKWESWMVKQIASKFREKYGDIIPIVLQIDTFTPQGGEWAPAYIFVHPQAEEFLGWVVE